MSTVSFGILKRRADDIWCYYNTSEVFVGVPAPQQMIDILAYERIWDRFYLTLNAAYGRMISVFITFWEQGLRRHLRLTQEERRKEINAFYRSLLVRLFAKRKSGGGGGEEGETNEGEGPSKPPNLLVTKLFGIGGDAVATVPKTSSS